MFWLDAICSAYAKKWEGFSRDVTREEKFRRYGTVAPDFGLFKKFSISTTPLAPLGRESRVMAIDQTRLTVCF
jgi:hypothetical protein